jgi:anti-sigma factor RsiW
MASFTDEELLAYLDESLPVARSAVIERELRGSDGLRCRLERLIAGQDQGGRTIGEIWRRTRASCPNRELWTAYLDGHVGDAMRNYLEFHLATIGCRYCAANLDDLRSSDDAAAQSRRAKIFQTSVGRLQSRRLD